MVGFVAVFDLSVVLLCEWGVVGRCCSVFLCLFDRDLAFFCFGGCGLLSSRIR